MGIGNPSRMSQVEFDSYIRSLSPNENCKFMIRKGVDLCTNPDNECVYRGKESFTTREGPKRECQREKTLKFKKLLG